MKLPEYALKQGIQVKDPNNSMGDPIEFPSGTLVFPFWNETLLPSHRRDQLKEASRYGKDERLVMCIIGSHWIPLPASNIRSNR